MTLTNFYTKDLVAEKYRDNIGHYTYGNPSIFDWNEGAILKIGKFCSFAEDVTIFLGGEHHTDWITTYPFPALYQIWPEAKDVKGHPKTKGDVIIGNDVWIGYGATILSGITIGNGAVIGARSVVTHNVADYTMVAGNPARIIKKRFDDKTIQRLNLTKWWNWPTEKIRNNLNNLCSSHINKLIV
ncbi:hypothetical protein A3C23_01650 [Candidatus Roizmanbacteria bacterium RIFCSPHIGHO2_02_FULL_37_13b]|uniref:Chloramphenicol acetyltransferase n=1 Tax=Candidatus Roizmanbacteria bacterium RIFCSPLOWO2_02_FULL_36_11 TaxID=1802071 RepID=A0A1F7JCV6_9BACT|nr:MAG: hypothetical protein A3C23_01650 [Candidatus Roizmanbacteria bacterium RIFCSPHIGHO2_02_FULL_37_13b]OGK53441.1 MAG: hypothetical protein A3H78_02810 [Candidatus Roizmanbacteria bacterium RIFCSPLOWO2_02_FULL_36_11]